MRKVILASTIALLGLTSTAQAHFILQAPPQTNPGDATQGKGSPPCGPDTMMAATPTPAQGGHPLMIKVLETVGHLGFYRVALAINSRSEIPVDNVVYDKNNKVLPPSGVPSGTSDHADIEMPAKFPVLADGLFSHETSSPNQMPYMGEVMLPNVNCDRCTLQVIEFIAAFGGQLAFDVDDPGVDRDTNDVICVHVSLLPGHCLVKVRVRVTGSAPLESAPLSPSARRPCRALVSTYMQAVWQWADVVVSVRPLFSLCLPQRPRRREKKAWQKRETAWA